MSRLLALALVLSPLDALALEPLRSLVERSPTPDLTGSPLLPETGLPQHEGFIEPLPAEARGGYQVLDLGDLSLVSGDWSAETLTGEQLAIARDTFLGQHGDDHDLVAVFTTERVGLVAFFTPLSNAIEGIGLPITDQTSAWGLPSLQGWLFLDAIDAYDAPAVAEHFFAHEVGHRWGARVRRLGGGGDQLGRDDAHWSFYLDSGRSPLEGNAWTEGPPGTFSALATGEVAFSPLDLYLMGLLSPDEVPPWFVVTNPVGVSNPLRWGLAPDDPDESPPPSVSPGYGLLRVTDGEEAAAAAGPIVVQGSRAEVTIEDVLTVEGPRDPATSPSSIRVAFVVLMPDDAPMTFAAYQAAEAIREGLPAVWERVTGGRSTLSSQLGASALHELGPTNTPDAPLWEPSTEAGCSHANSGGASWLSLVALFGLLATRARRPST